MQPRASPRLEPLEHKALADRALGADDASRISLDDRLGMSNKLLATGSRTESPSSLGNPISGSTLERPERPKLRVSGTPGLELRKSADQGHVRTRHKRNSYGVGTGHVVHSLLTEDARDLGYVEGITLTERDCKRAVNCLKRSKLINELANVDLMVVAKLLRGLDFEPGIKVIKYGDLGNCCYVVDTGELDVYVGEGGSTARKPTVTIGAGELFGELGALYECTRTATVVAKTHVRAWKLRHEDLTAVLRTEAVGTRKKVFDMLRASETLKHLDEKALSKVADLCEEVSFPSQAHIIREGEVGEAMYIIISGSVVVTQARKAHNSGGNGVVSGFAAPVRRKEVFCRIVGAGGYFGERALLMKEARSASVQAAAETHCLMIRADAFHQLVGPFHNFLKERLITDDREGAQREVASMALAQTAPAYRKLKVVKPLGSGRLSAVALVDHPQAYRLYALKIISKVTLARREQVEQVRAERDLLQAVGSHPCIVQLFATYQDARTLYLLLELCPGGDLFSLIHDNGHLPQKAARLYAAAVVLALERIHHVGFVYRDVKPENVLIDAQGFPRLCDFGLAKRLSGDARAYSSVGTLEYMAPEVLKRTGHSFAADWWSLGVLIFEMLVGRTPFVPAGGLAKDGDQEANAMQLMGDILRGHIHWPGPEEPTISKDASSLITRLLRVQPADRLGHQAKGVVEIVEHPFFAGLDLHGITARTVAVPYRPELSGAQDTSCFNVDMTNFARMLQGDQNAKIEPFAHIPEW